MSLLSTIFSISIYANTIIVTHVFLFIYRQKLNTYGSKTCFFILLFHFIVTEMKEDTVNSNAMYMVEIENLYVSRNDMLISIF